MLRSLISDVVLVEDNIRPMTREVITTKIFATSATVSIVPSCRYLDGSRTLMKAPAKAALIKHRKVTIGTRNSTRTSSLLVIRYAAVASARTLPSGTKSAAHAAAAAHMHPAPSTAHRGGRGQTRATRKTRI